MTFKPGMAKVAGSGRKVGVPDRRVRAARAGMQTALELLNETDRQGKPANPIVFLKELNHLLRASALEQAVTSVDKDGNPVRPDTTGWQIREYAAVIGRLPRGKAELVLDYLKAAQDGWYKLAQFAYPKLAQIDLRDPTMRDLLGLMDGTAAASVQYSREDIVLRLQRQGVNIERVLDVDVDTGADADDDVTVEGGSFARTSGGNGKAR